MNEASLGYVQFKHKGLVGQAVPAARYWQGGLSRNQLIAKSHDLRKVRNAISKGLVHLGELSQRLTNDLEFALDRSLDHVVMDVGLVMHS